VKDQTRARNRLGKFLLRQSRRRPEGMKAWGQRHLAWLRAQTWEHKAHQLVFADALAEIEHCRERVERLDQGIEAAIQQAPAQLQALVTALQALRGVRMVTAATVATEVGEVARFGQARQLMAYIGLVPSENSTGGPGRARRGGITKTGNAHVRRVLVEAAWHYRHVPSRARTLRARLAATNQEIRHIAWKAQGRLHARYWRLIGKGKAAPEVAVAVARELAGFMWAIAREVEQSHPAGTKN
jgi:transposase